MIENIPFDTACLLKIRSNGKPDVLSVTVSLKFSIEIDLATRIGRLPFKQFF